MQCARMCLIDCQKFCSSVVGFRYCFVLKSRESAEKRESGFHFGSRRFWRQLNILNKSGVRRWMIWKIHGCREVYFQNYGRPGDWLVFLRCKFKLRDMGKVYVVPKQKLDWEFSIFSKASSQPTLPTSIGKFPELNRKIRLKEAEKITTYLNIEQNYICWKFPSKPFIQRNYVEILF